jgi:hypothetical protein
MMEPVTNPPHDHPDAPALDPEVRAIAEVTWALDGLDDDDQRGRVVAFVLSRYGRMVVPGVTPSPRGRGR